MDKIKLRPIIETIVKDSKQSLQESFQNETLRPILKLQHDLIHAFFNNYLSEKKLDLNQLDALKKKEMIDLIFRQDDKFKIELKGIIIGLFTPEEYIQYIPLKKEYNKRIYTMAKERISSILL
jgi:hypothetical protein